MPVFSYAWPLPVTWQRWLSHYSIDRSQRTCFVALCFIEPKLLLIEFLHRGHRDFRSFLLLWPWPWSDDFYIRPWPVFPLDVPRVRKWTSYIKAFETIRITYIHTDRQTDRQTNMTEMIYHASSPVISNPACMMVW